MTVANPFSRFYSVGRMVPREQLRGDLPAEETDIMTDLVITD